MKGVKRSYANCGGRQMIDKVHFDVPGIIEADDVEALAGEGEGGWGSAGRPSEHAWYLRGGQ